VCAPRLNSACTARSVDFRWGTHTKASGEVYEGEWVDDVMEGKARVTFPDGAYFEGEFTNGLRVKVSSLR